ncbi:protein LURP-one-related 17-like [Actinidia eriantha]|uniref:protein LURP-one-related 17-like n=1 Tax=Actinidia eriantha TaxID=165200 RepID=UPI002587FB13|nr:protein LURP-one-related 17-like [Actinidia eriantha]
MILSMKSIPRTVPGNHHEQDLKSGGAWTSLTVWRKSLVLSCNGFTVIDCKGNLVFRVDNYAERPEEVILMDGSGKPVLTICRHKKLRVLADSWRVYEGEVGDSFSSKKPICCVRKYIKILHPNVSVLAHVYHGSSHKKYAYIIEGSYGRRSCQVLDESRRVVAEIRRKEAVNSGVSFGLEVFVLIVRPGFNPNFAMAIVLLLDQMFS